MFLVPLGNATSPMKFQLKKTYNIARTVASQSGFAWHLEHGADIQPEGASVWDAYVQVITNQLSLNCTDLSDRKILMHAHFATRASAILNDSVNFHLPKQGVLTTFATKYPPTPQ